MSQGRCLKLGEAFNRLDEIVTEVEPFEVREGNVGNFLDDLAILAVPFLLIDVHSLSSLTFHSLNASIAYLSLFLAFFSKVRQWLRRLAMLTSSLL